MAGYGTEIALVASLIGSGLSAKASADANKEQKQITRRAGEAAQQLTGESIAAAKQGAQKYAPDERAATQAQAEQAIGQSLGSALVESQNRPMEETSGRVSDEFLTSKAKAATDRTSRGVKLAQMMAKMRAPSDLRFAEGISNADTVSQIGANTGDARNIFRGGQVDASGVFPNAGMQLAGDAVRIGGSAYNDRDRRNRLANSGIYGDYGDYGGYGG